MKSQAPTQHTGVVKVIHGDILDQVLAIITEEAQRSSFGGDVRIVVYAP